MQKWKEITSSERAGASFRQIAGTQGGGCFLQRTDYPLLGFFGAFNLLAGIFFNLLESPFDLMMSPKSPVKHSLRSHWRWARSANRMISGTFLRDLELVFIFFVSRRSGCEEIPSACVR